MENICKKGKSCYRFYGILMNIAAILQLTSFAIGIFYSFFYNLIAVIILDGGFRFSNIGYYVRNAINIETLIYSILCLGIFFLIRYYGKQYLRANGEKEIKEKILNKKVLWVVILGFFTYYWTPKVFGYFIEPFIFSFAFKGFPYVSFILFVLPMISIIIMLVINIKSEKVSFGLNCDKTGNNAITGYLLIITYIFLIVYVFTRIFIEAFYLI